jgi:adenylate cyclase
MAEEVFKRKLTAIFSADVEGYSRLMDNDEEATVRTITSYRTAITDLVQQYRGRVVDTTGDNILAEFTSVVDSVNCAVEIQRELAERNAELPYNRKMEFRIGVNLGDVIEEEGRIYGDGVNIAARVESMAEAGGICISGRAYDQVANKLGLEYENLGEHQVKNISAPIRVYRVLSFPSAAAHRVVQAKDALRRRWRKIALPIAAVVVVAVVVLGIWQFYLRRPSVEPASVEKMAFPLPDKPSIAVLPFDNMSGDQKQEYIADGITENVITALSKTPNLFVIARNSSFTYKGKPVKVQQVSEELGVRYVLEGSVQKSGDRVRLTAQLVDAIEGRHLWAERYDRNLKDIFAIQDEITLKIILALQVKLTEGEQARVLAKGTDNLKAYLKVLEGIDHGYRWNKEANVRAKQLFEEAITLDPEYATAYERLGVIHVMDVWLGASKSPRKSLARATELAQKAIALDDSLAFPHGLLGLINTMIGQYEKAIAESERAVSLEANSADSYAYLATALRYAGRPQEAIPLFKKAIRLNPIPPSWYLNDLGYAYSQVGRYEEAISAYKKALHHTPDNLFVHLGLAFAYISSGRQEEARAAASEVLRIDPMFSLDKLEKDTKAMKTIFKESFYDNLRKAGLK